MESIVLGGGCFWCLEAAYQMVDGVTDVTSGYAGGNDQRPTYEKVCAGDTGHAEVVKITFDPTVLSLDQILAIFWVIHDPTTLNRQGADVGTQYRSIILYTNEAQRKIAKESLASAQSLAGEPIVTELVPLEAFYAAEPYHQNYFLNHPEQGYCQAVIAPKLHKLRAHFSQQLKATEQ